LIGYSPDTTAQPIASLDAVLLELKKRYPKMLSKLEEIRKESEIHPDAFAGLVYDELYRLLDGVAQNATDIRTPEQVKDLRQQLRTKAIRLANLRSKSQQQATPDK
jgi:hypothetical protein